MNLSPEYILSLRNRSLPPEVYNRVFSTTDVPDLLHTLQSNKRMFDLAHYELGQRFRDVLHPYIKHVFACAAVLRRTNTLVTGYNATAYIFSEMLHDSSRCSQHPLQLSVKALHRDDVLNHLQTVQEYDTESITISPYTLYHYHHGVRMIYSLFNGISRIELLVLDTDLTALYALPHAPTTALMNALHPDYFLSFYAELTFTKIGLVNDYCYIPLQPNNIIAPRLLQHEYAQRFEALELKGFQNLEHPPLCHSPSSTDRECRLKRSTDDIFIIRFKTPFDYYRTDIHPNPLSPDPQRLVWSLGGYACDANRALHEPF